jgi:hypothetical protein
MLISGHLTRLGPYRQWDQPTYAERELEQPAAVNPAEDKTGQAPFTPRPVLEPAEAERFSRRHARPSALAVEQNDARAREALDAYHEVSTNQEREYVRAVFGVDIYV